MDRVQTGSTTKPGSSKPNNWDHGLGLSFGKMKWDGQWSRSRLTVQSVRHCWTLFKRTWSHIQSVRFWVLMDYIAQALTIETHNINESPLKKKKTNRPKEGKDPLLLWYTRHRLQKSWHFRFLKSSALVPLDLLFTTLLSHLYCISICFPNISILAFR